MLTVIDRATELLKDKSVTTEEIHQATGISVKLLNEARTAKDVTSFVNNLKYSEVIALTDLFNNLQIDYLNKNHDNDFYKFVIRIGEWFDESIGIQEEYFQSEEGLDDDLMVATAVQTLNDISTKDKSIMLDLYFSYTRDEQNML
ncbi:hypothetical protein [Companilactobacillus heilongjiangensis]|uniref:Uncharacterized protein n=1 Tax=Companilactobacillus heilongjiangensis TaxID=1074467 RepID=A0A0K2LBZ7_9LACO|nr:hypothetical protein [Companilactobacillus heilongjiangensis]ALB28824.1 hypothetical protein JP39_05300 [Companilactobacillus heilongjiangensis]